ncbi:spore coat protein SP96-like isoform X2 [Rhopilema esculentum]|uniref:spore coat protein SP96-like isoform X2 n=1 Tax=Rhopilema esculentum TaxID=499914 RepID=UPI0031D5E50A
MQEFTMARTFLLLIVALTTAEVTVEAASVSTSIEAALSSNSTPTSIMPTSSTTSEGGSQTLSGKLPNSTPTYIMPSQSTTSQGGSPTSSACTTKAPSCDTTRCCIGSNGAWSGVNSAANITYFSGCRNQTQESMCKDVCNNDQCSRGAELQVSVTAVLLVAIAFWWMTWHQR